MHERMHLCLCFANVRTDALHVHARVVVMMAVVGAPAHASECDLLAHGVHPLTSVFFLYTCPPLSQQLKVHGF